MKIKFFGKSKTASERKYSDYEGLNFNSTGYFNIYIIYFSDRRSTKVSITRFRRSRSGIHRFYQGKLVKVSRPCDPILSQFGIIKYSENILYLKYIIFEIIVKNVQDNLEPSVGSYCHGPLRTRVFWTDMLSLGSLKLE